MRVLEHHQDRLGAGQLFDLADEGVERALPALRRSLADRGITVIAGEAEEIRQKRRVGGGRGLLQHRIELV